MGGVTGVATLSFWRRWLGGGLVPRTCPPPPVPSGGAARRATGARGALLAGRGRGRGGSRVVGPSSTPLPLARPEKIVPGEGGWRGG